MGGGASSRGSRPGLANHALADLTYRNLELAGPPEYNEQAVNLAREIQQNLGIDPMEEPYLAACQKLISPQEAEKQLRRGWNRIASQAAAILLLIPVLPIIARLPRI